MKRRFPTIKNLSTSKAKTEEIRLSIDNTLTVNCPPLPHFKVGRWMFNVRRSPSSSPDPYLPRADPYLPYQWNKNQRMTKSETILATLKAHLPELREMGVQNLYVFGSVARAEPNPHDVDVMAEFKQPPGLLEFMGVKFLLEEKAGLPVDLYSTRACPARFRKRIENEMFHVA